MPLATCAALITRPTVRSSLDEVIQIYALWFGKLPRPGNVLIEMYVLYALPEYQRAPAAGGRASDRSAVCRRAVTLEHGQCDLDHFVRRASVGTPAY